MRIGIVIPAHNEELFLPDCLQSLQAFIDAGDTVLVVDAGSTDQTADIAVREEATVIASASSARGTAVSLGIERLLAQGEPPDVILIAHADMIFPREARSDLIDALEHTPDCPGGCFGHRIRARGLFFRVVERGNRMRATQLQMPYGDQAQFFRPTVLPAIHGFPRQEWLEDFELALRLRAVGTLLYLPHPVEIPARHWESGKIGTTLRNWRTIWRYLRQRKNSLLDFPKPA